MAPGQTITVFLGPLPAGEYKFFGDFHQDTLKASWWRNEQSIIHGFATLVLLAPLQPRADFHVVSPLEIDLGKSKSSIMVRIHRSENFGGQQTSDQTRHWPDIVVA